MQMRKIDSNRVRVFTRGSRMKEFMPDNIGVWQDDASTCTTCCVPI